MTNFKRKPSKPSKAISNKSKNIRDISKSSTLLYQITQDKSKL
jgi:hypothetical protein